MILYIYIYIYIYTHVRACVSVCIYPIPVHEQHEIQGKFYKRSLLGLNTEFWVFFS